MTTAAANASALRVRALLARTAVAARRDRMVTGVILLGLLVRVVYWEVTDRKFEDGLITVTHAVNLVDGIGLTHHPGEPVTHGFTTALSVLVPVVGELLSFLPKMDGFLMLRLVSLAAFALTVPAAAVLCKRLGVGAWPRAFVLLFLALDYNQIFYGMAGMETQMAVAILLWSVVATIDRRPVAAGLLFGSCFLVRPDFGLFVAPALVSLFLWNRREALRSAAIAAGVVAPWVIFTTIYYGSPVPNTIKAKALRYHVEYPSTINPVKWWEFISQQVYARNDWWHTFTPFLENGLVTDAPILPFFSAVIAATLLGLAVIGAASSRHIAGWRAALAFVVVFAAYRLIALPESYYEWYYPPFTALVVICAGVGLTHLAKVGPRTTGAVAAALAALFAWPLVAMTVIDSRVQHRIEDKVRMPLGLWLRANVPDDEIVTSESAGYVGFYGRRKLYDYPGLTSKQALRIMQRLGWRRNNMFEEVNAARPNYVVFRPNELDAFKSSFPQTAALYTPVARFTVDPAKSSTSWGGVSYVNIDRDFIVVKRAGS